MDAAWPHIAGIVASERADKSLLLAAIEAAATIHPQEAPGILGDLMNSEDEDIAEAEEVLEVEEDQVTELENSSLFNIQLLRKSF